MVGAFGLTQQNGIAQDAGTLIANVGMVVAFVSIYLWWYQIFRTLNPIKARLESHDKTYEIIRTGRSRWPGANTVLGLIVPIIFLSLWIVIRLTIIG